MTTFTQVRRRQAGQRIQDGCPRRTNGRCTDGSARLTSCRGVTTLTSPHDEHSHRHRAGRGRLLLGDAVERLPALRVDAQRDLPAGRGAAAAQPVEAGLLRAHPNSPSASSR